MKERKKKLVKKIKLKFSCHGGSSTSLTTFSSSGGNTSSRASNKSNSTTSSLSATPTGAKAKISKNQKKLGKDTTTQEKRNVLGALSQQNPDALVSDSSDRSRQMLFVLVSVFVIGGVTGMFFYKRTKKASFLSKISPKQQPNLN